jgi:soluble lytic murein transglycosylase
MTIALVAGGLLVMAFPASGKADIYKYVDRSGIVHFTNVPTSSRFHLYMKEHSEGSAATVHELICRYASRFHLEEALLRAVIKVESDFNPRAVSCKGAQGIMQLIPETAQDMRVENPFDIEENIRGGSHYLRLMLDRFNGNLQLALAAYNAGPDVIRRFGGVPPFQETRSYVERVMHYLRLYRQDKDSVP